MRDQIKIYSIVIALSISGCVAPDSQNSWRTETIIIPDIIQSSEEFCLSRSFTEVNLIELETNDSSMIVGVDRIAISKKRILILDKLGSRILVFDKSGEHLFNISFPEGDFIQGIINLSLTQNDQITLTKVNDYNSELYRFDKNGKNLNKIELLKNIHSIVTAKDFVISYHSPPFHQSNKNFLFSTSTSGHKLDRFVTYSLKKNVDQILFYNFYHYGETYNFWDFSSSAIYSFDSSGQLLKETKIVPTIDLRLNPESVTDRLVFSQKIKSKSVVLSAFENKKYVFITQLCKMRKETIVLNKHSKQFIKMGREKESSRVGIIDDVITDLRVWPEGISTCGELFCVLERNEVVNNLKDTEPQNEQVKEVLTTSVMDNPIILMIK